MQIVIDISERAREKVFDILNDGLDFPLGFQCLLLNSIANGTPIPDNATNGDVIKAMFPNFRLTDHFALSETCEIYYFSNGNEICAIRCSKEWWNAPYKAEREQE